jgi:hypothetical protein
VRNRKKRRTQVVCSRTNLKVTLGSVVLGRSNSFKST